jgi:uncharacterized membrane protein YgdD (TMEM256/DUF423 family)
MKKFSIISGAAFAALSVAFGAFGSHLLKDSLMNSGYYETFQIAVKYQMYHALGLIICGVLLNSYHSRLINFAVYGFSIGIIFFSGSLYGISLMDLKFIAILTPVGGAAFLFGWISLCAWGIKLSKNS